MASSAPKFVIQAVVWASLATGSASPGLSQTVPKHAQNNPLAHAVSYCRDHPRVIRLNDERNILCFDGPILPDLDLTPILNLGNGGLFVVRSMGGYMIPAKKIANLLRDKGAAVVIYDYCLSACAGFLFIASTETYVTRSSVVAWHAPCGDGPIKHYTHDELQRRCEAVLPRSDFFASRAVDKNQRVDRFVYSPQSSHTKKMVRITYDGALSYRDVFWMWNPRHYPNYFKAKITYEAYPKSQDEVDEITKSFHLPHILYDP